MKTRDFICLAILIIGFGLIFVLSDHLERVRPELPDGYLDEDLSLKGEKLRGYSLGFEGLIADWYWMRSLQYMGQKITQNKDKGINIADLRPLNPRLLYPLLDNATTLDPKFRAAYSYGSIVLPAIDNEQAVKITRKGIKNNPDEWQFYHFLGYIYWNQKQFSKAAEAYEEGSKIPGAPLWMKTLGARMMSEGGERETARAVYRRILEEAEDARTRQSAQLWLDELDSRDERDAINEVLREIKSRSGNCPRSFREIFGALRNKKLPGGKDFRLDQQANLVDPTGVPYLLDSETCTAIVDAAKSNLPRKQ